MLPDYSNLYNSCQRAYDKIGQFENGNYFYVKPDGDLELQKVDQNSLIGAWSATIGKTVTNWSYGSEKADWRSVTSEIEKVNGQLKNLLDAHVLEDPDSSRDLNIKKLDLAIEQSARALHKVAQDYLEQSKQRWTRGTDKKEASTAYEKLARESYSLHLRLNCIIKELDSDEIPNADEFDGADNVLTSAFETLTDPNVLQEMDLENFEDAWLNAKQEAFSGGKDFLFNLAKQSDAIGDILRRSPESVSIKQLKEWAVELNKQIKKSDQSQGLKDLHALIQGDIAVRQSSMVKLTDSLKEAKSEGDVIRILGSANHVILEEPAVKALLKEVVSESHQRLAESLLREYKESGKVPDSIELIKGASVIVHESLKSSVGDTSAMFINHREKIEDLHGLLFSANTLIQDIAPNAASTMLQTTLVSVFNQLADICLLQQRTQRAKAYIEGCQGIRISSSHPVGDIGRVADMSKKSATWLEAGDQTVRRRNVRCQFKKIESGGRTTENLCFAFTVGEAEREKLSRRMSFLSKSGLLEDQSIKQEITKATYQTFDRSDNTYKDTVTVNAGEAVSYTDSSGKITLTIGTNDEKWNQYQKINVTADASVKAEDLYAFLTLFGLSTAMMQSRREDVMLENKARLANAVRPKETALQSSREETLDAIVSNADKVMIEKRAENMHLKDVGKGRMEYVDSHAIKDFWLSGGRGFAATLGHDGVTFNPLEVLSKGFYKTQKIESAATTLGYILKGGLISTFERFEMGIIGAGNAPEENIETGSANQVFTRPLTDNQFESAHDWRSYAIEGNILLLMDARLAERLPYGYAKDRAGIRNPHHVSKKMVRVAQKERPERGLRGEMMTERETLSDICKKQRANNYTLPTAEVMFEDVVGPDYIYGAVVNRPEDKAEVIRVLTGMGIDNIQGVPLNEAIFVGKLDKSMIKQVYEE
ncbi:hypothetical protein [Estrella lausannensis]|uniref:Uncharacterized protein n=1 Tax=Estrella lausannensis TaxID=483423 RepID=A0A0H5DNU1_9BACT|nr:hypothetical protein [Estrella lausannensis]CRX37972.1 Conserved hypothetical protein [Estrella lausannensis]